MRAHFQILPTYLFFPLPRRQFCSGNPDQKSGLLVEARTEAPTSTIIERPPLSRVNLILFILFLLFSLFCTGLLITYLLEAQSWLDISGPEMFHEISIQYEKERLQEELEKTQRLHGNRPELLEGEVASCQERQQRR